MERGSKAEANYREGHGATRCSACRYFVPGDPKLGACHRVRGMIGPDMLCDWFEPGGGGLGNEPPPVVKSLTDQLAEVLGVDLLSKSMAGQHGPIHLRVSREGTRVVGSPGRRGVIARYGIHGGEAPEKRTLDSLKAPSRIGEINILHVPHTGETRVASVRVRGGPRSLGLAQVRAIRDRIGEDFQRTTHITGWRETGAREASRKRTGRDPNRETSIPWRPKPKPVLVKSVPLLLKSHPSLIVHPPETTVEHRQNGEIWARHSHRVSDTHGDHRGHVEVVDRGPGRGRHLGYTDDPEYGEDLFHGEHHGQLYRGVMNHHPRTGEPVQDHSTRLGTVPHPHAYLEHHAGDKVEEVDHLHPGRKHFLTPDGRILATNMHFPFGPRRITPESSSKRFTDHLGQTHVYLTDAFTHHGYLPIYHRMHGQPGDKRAEQTRVMVDHTVTPAQHATLEGWSKEHKLRFMHNAQEGMGKLGSQVKWNPLDLPTPSVPHTGAGRPANVRAGIQTKFPGWRQFHARYRQAKAEAEHAGRTFTEGEHAEGRNRTVKFEHEPWWKVTPRGGRVSKALAGTLILKRVGGFGKLHFKQVEAPYPDDDGDQHRNFHIHDDRGRHILNLDTSYYGDQKWVEAHYLGDPGQSYRKVPIGVGGVRQIYRHIKKTFPEARGMDALRVTGAHNRASRRGMGSRYRTIDLTRYKSLPPGTLILKAMPHREAHLRLTPGGSYPMGTPGEPGYAIRREYGIHAGPRPDHEVPDDIRAPGRLGYMVVKHYPHGTNPRRRGGWHQQPGDTHIHEIETEDGPRSLGPRTIRGMFRHVQEHLPETKFFTGERVSGLREFLFKKTGRQRQRFMRLRARQAPAFGKGIPHGKLSFHPDIDEESHGYHYWMGRIHNQWGDHIANVSIKHNPDTGKTEVPWLSHPSDDLSRKVDLGISGVRQLHRFIGERFAGTKRLKAERITGAHARAEALGRGSRYREIDYKSLLVLKAAGAAPRVTPHMARQIGNRLGVDWKVIAPETLARGMRVELEHGRRADPTNVTGDDLVKTARIALAHLEEREDYYGRLAHYVEDAPGGKPQQVFKGKGGRGPLPEVRLPRGRA